MAAAEAAVGDNGGGSSDCGNGGGDGSCGGGGKRGPDGDVDRCRTCGAKWKIRQQKGLLWIERWCGGGYKVVVMVVMVWERGRDG